MGAECPKPSVQSTWLHSNSGQVGPAKRSAKPWTTDADGPRRRTRDPEDEKRRILAAAAAEFAEHWPAATRMDDIADRAGLNKQLLFRYFESKERLFLVVLERMFGRFEGGLRGTAGRCR